MHVSRRTFVAFTSLSSLGATVAPAARAASTKLGKADVNYQLTPKGSARCGLCASFRPAASPAAPGACVLVDGEIPPNGWCVLFSPAAARK